MDLLTATSSAKPDDYSFTFSIDSVFFHNLGQYKLKLSILSSYLETKEVKEAFEDIRIRLNDEIVDIRASDITTSVIRQEVEGKINKCKDLKFTFHLPKGELSLFSTET